MTIRSYEDEDDASFEAYQALKELESVLAACSTCEIACENATGEPPSRHVLKITSAVKWLSDEVDRQKNSTSNTEFELHEKLEEMESLFSEQLKRIQELESLLAHMQVDVYSASISMLITQLIGAHARAYEPQIQTRKGTNR